MRLIASKLGSHRSSDRLKSWGNIKIGGGNSRDPLISNHSANNTAASKPIRRLPQWRPSKKKGTSISVMISPVSRR